MLKFTIKEKDKKLPNQKVQEICDELRIYNPMVSKVTIDILMPSFSDSILSIVPLIKILLRKNSVKFV